MTAPFSVAKRSFLKNSLTSSIVGNLSSDIVILPFIFSYNKGDVKTKFYNPLEINYFFFLPLYFDEVREYNGWKQKGQPSLRAPEGVIPCVS